VTPRSTPLLGFKPPYVKAGEVVLPVLTGTGDWHELIATPATWQRIGLSMGLLMDPVRAKPSPTPSPATSKREPVLKPGTRRILSRP
jgi:hypothetical protein